MKSNDGNFPIAVHPGEILQEMIEENGLSQVQLARHLKMDPSKINEICKGRRGISAEMAVILAKAFGVTASTWMNLQKNWELSLVDESIVEDVEPLRRRA
jgi:addiction module HigA family antidote